MDPSGWFLVNPTNLKACTANQPPKWPVVLFSQPQHSDFMAGGQLGVGVVPLLFLTPRVVEAPPPMEALRAEDPQFLPLPGPVPPPPIQSEKIW